MVPVYMSSLDSQFNLLSSLANVLGKSAFCTPQSEIAGAVLASRMEQKISQELSKNDPASSPVFYGTRLM